MALLSDIFDGVLARRWKCDTAGVRLFDSMADIVFYVGCAIALWMRHPSVVRGLAVPITAVVGLEALCLAVGFVKFGKLPSYHSYLAKIWGLVLASALVAAFVTKHPAGWIVAALALGVLSNLEGTGDVIDHAGVEAGCEDACRGMATARNRTTRQVAIRSEDAASAAMYLMFAVAALPLHAQKSAEAIYETGTSADRRKHHRADDRYRKWPAVRGADSTCNSLRQDRQQRGIPQGCARAPGILSGDVHRNDSSREHIYRLTLSYYDDAGRKSGGGVSGQPRDDSISLSELLRMRVPQCKDKAHCMPL